MIKMAVLGAGSRGMHAFGPYALSKPHEVQFTAVAEPNEEKRLKLARDHGIPPERQFTTWEELLAQPKLADTLLIATPDNCHYEPTLLGLERGYHILLEKPMSPDPLESIRMAEAAEAAGKLLMICHTMRYVNYFETVKGLIESGRIGDLVTIQWNENVGWYHQAHSFVRGNWRNAAESSPMILAKCCHDMDMIQWLVDAPVRKVSSFGGLKYFHAGNAPEGSTLRCTDGCAVEHSCPYSAIKWYYNTKPGWPQNVVTVEPTLEARKKALEEGPYGRCVFHCDNDVVDHQVVNMEFEGGVTVAFTMAAFTNEDHRSFKILGTKGEIRGHSERNDLTVELFAGNKEVIAHPLEEGGHGGGDYGVMREFLRMVHAGEISNARTSPAISAQSHLLAFAAEKSRLSGETVDMAAYVRELKQG